MTENTFTHFWLIFELDELDECDVDYWQNEPSNSKSPGSDGPSHKP